MEVEGGGIGVGEALGEGGSMTLKKRQQEGSSNLITSVAVMNNFRNL